MPTPEQEKKYAEKVGKLLIDIGILRKRNDMCRIFKQASNALWLIDRLVSLKIIDPVTYEWIRKDYASTEASALFCSIKQRGFLTKEATYPFLEKLIKNVFKVKAAANSIKNALNKPIHPKAEPFIKKVGF